jgi:UDP-glucuronate 4-epimerase
MSLLLEGSRLYRWKFFIEIIEKSAGKKAKKELLPMQMGDVPVTWADTAELEVDTGYRPQTGIEEGVPCFVEWYKGYMSNVNKQEPR